MMLTLMRGMLLALTNVVINDEMESEQLYFPAI